VGAGFVWGSWDELRCVGRPADCNVFVGVGGTISFLGLVAIAAGVLAARSALRRAVTPTGGSGWRWALAVLFGIGAAVLVSRFPSHTCPPGVHLSGEPFRLCIDLVRHERYDPTSWIGLKWVLAVAIPMLGLVAVRLRVPVIVAAPVAAATWLVGMGWLLLDTMAREFLHG
jgi:hypothetical protein